MDSQSVSRPLALLSQTCNLANADASEEDKIQAMMSQSTHEYDPMNYLKQHSEKTFESVPTIKKSTGIPRSFMVEVDDPSIKGAMLTNCGRYAVPAIDAEAYAKGKKERPPETLHDAVLTPCCGNSYCDDCIRSALLESDHHVCPTCNQTGVSPDTLVANKFLRQAVDGFDSEMGHKKSQTGPPGAPQTPTPTPGPNPPPLTAAQTLPRRTYLHIRHQQDPLVSRPPASTTPPSVQPGSSAHGAPPTSPHPAQKLPDTPSCREAEAETSIDAADASLPSGTPSPEAGPSSPPALMPPGYHVPVAEDQPTSRTMSPSYPAAGHSEQPPVKTSSSVSGVGGGSAWSYPVVDPRPFLPPSGSSAASLLPPPVPLHHFHPPPPLFPSQPYLGYPPGYPFSAPPWAPPGLPSARPAVPPPPSAPSPSISSPSLVPPFIPKGEMYRHRQGTMKRDGQSLQTVKSTPDEVGGDFAKELLEYRRIQKQRRRSYSRSRPHHRRSSVRRHADHSRYRGYKRPHSPTPPSSSPSRRRRSSKSRSWSRSRSGGSHRRHQATGRDRPQQGANHSPHGGRNHSPHGGRNHSPHGGRNHSPHGGRNHSPHGGRNHSPHGGRNHTPHGGRNHSPHGGRNHSPHGGRNHSPHGGRSHFPLGGRNHTPHGVRNHTPHGVRNHSPLGWNHSPLVGRNHSPLGRNHSPLVGRNHSPLGKNHSPLVGRNHSPLGRNHSPLVGRNHSPLGRNHSPLVGRNHSPLGKNHSPLVGRNHSPLGMNHSPLGGRNHSPLGRNHSPHGHPGKRSSSVVSQYQKCPGGDPELYRQWEREYMEWYDKYFGSYTGTPHHLPPPPLLPSQRHTRGPPETGHSPSPLSEDGALTYQQKCSAKYGRPGVDDEEQPEQEHSVAGPTADGTTPVDRDDQSPKKKKKRRMKERDGVEPGDASHGHRKGRSHLPHDVAESDPGDDASENPCGTLRGAGGKEEGRRPRGEGGTAEPGRTREDPDRRLARGSKDGDSRAEKTKRREEKKKSKSLRTKVPLDDHRPDSHQTQNSELGRGGEDPKHGTRKRKPKTQEEKEPEIPGSPAESSLWEGVTKKPLRKNISININLGGQLFEARKAGSVKGDRADAAEENLEATTDRGREGNMEDDGEIKTWIPKSMEEINLGGEGMKTKLKRQCGQEDPGEPMGERSSAPGRKSQAEETPVHSGGHGSSGQEREMVAAKSEDQPSSRDGLLPPQHHLVLVKVCPLVDLCAPQAGH
ncbi:hypothetical protein NHX12_032325 [Muraenolepis orangiensis]|uniref:Uncharacterized protein n=1 Tax=Muraenolepis orangiensis TaxID=630683 RepID=A0A9Q0E5J2_9TELE|nr:hypothetical protein NHX12_032325 [Muraenolepis orangiensis]